MQQVANLVKEMRDQQTVQHNLISEQTRGHIKESIEKMTQISEAIAERQQFLEATLKDQVTKMDTLQEQSIKHARLTNDTLTKEVTRIEKVMSTMEQYMKHQVSDLQGQINSLTQDTQKWQVNFEDMQARKILEIHQAIKVLN